MSKLNKKFRAKASRSFSPELVKPQEVTNIFFIQEDEEVKLKEIEDIWFSDCFWCNYENIDDPDCNNCPIGKLIDKIWDRQTF